MQVAYPTLDSMNVIGWLNALVLVLCVATWVLRFFLPKDLTDGPSTLSRYFVAVDLLVLLFISYGVLLNINGVLDGSEPEIQSAVVAEIIEDPFSPDWFLPVGRSPLTGAGTAAVVTEIIKNPVSPGWFFPAGRSLLTGSESLGHPKYIALRRSMVEYLLIGQEVTFLQYKGFLGIPWVSDVRVDRGAVSQDLRASNDPIIKKDIALAELNKPQWERGLEDARAYTSEVPEDIEFVIAATEALLKKWQARSAVEFLKPLVAAHPSYRLYVRYAEILPSIGEHERAIESLQAAVTMDSRPIMALYGLGSLLKERGRFDEATAAFEQLLAIEPNYPVVKDVIREMRRQSGSEMSVQTPSSQSR